MNSPRAKFVDVTLASDAICMNDGEPNPTCTDAWTALPTVSDVADHPEAKAPKVQVHEPQPPVAVGKNTAKNAFAPASAAGPLRNGVVAIAGAYRASNCVT
jgi:hypothetical protein